MLGLGSARQPFSLSLGNLVKKLLKEKMCQRWRRLDWVKISRLIAVIRLLLEGILLLIEVVIEINNPLCSCHLLILGVLKVIWINRCRDKERGMLIWSMKLHLSTTVDILSISQVTQLLDHCLVEAKVDRYGERTNSLSRSYLRSQLSWIQQRKPIK